MQTNGERGPKWLFACVCLDADQSKAAVLREFFLTKMALDNGNYEVSMNIVFFN